MPESWLTIPIDSKVLSNVGETSLKNRAARIENAYINDENALVRFPHLQEYATLPISNRVFLYEYLGDLVAVCGGHLYRLDDEEIPNITDVTKAAITGAGRPTFALGEDQLNIAAGGQIIKLQGNKTEILSVDAPESTHVATIAGYTIAIEPGSGRFYHTPPGQPSVWDPLDVFSAEGDSDNLTAAVVTKFKELLLCGPRSIEQFDPAPSGTKPFLRRWVLGAGLYAPYTIISVNNRVWCVDDEREFVSIGAQSVKPESRDVRASLKSIDDWTDAWAQPLGLNDQNFILLQIPFAINVYGTQGVTFLYDYEKLRWYNLFGWDTEQGLPSRWGGWSVQVHNQEIFVGGDGGKIYKLSGYGTESDPVERFLFRSGHINFKGKVDVRIERMRMRLMRGDANNPIDREAFISVRVNKDNKGFGNWQRKSLGKPGERNMVLQFGSQGIAQTWQFEFMVTDRCAASVSDFEAEVTPMKR